MKSPRNIINERVLFDLKKRSSFGLIFYFILAVLLLSAADYYLKQQFFAGVFFIAVCITCLIRLIHILFFKPFAKWQPKVNKAFFLCSILLTAIVWGTGFAAFMLQEGVEYNKSLMTVCSAAICAGGVVAFLPKRMLAVLYNALLLLPASIVLLVLGENLSLAVMIILFFMFMLILTYRGNSEYWIALENEIKLQELSRIDALTGLFNRRYFNEVYEGEWKRASRDGSLITIIMGDIDHFKQVNDTYGHLAGDLYLKQFAEILGSVFKRDTDLVVRFGGEEFVVLLLETNTIQAFEMAEKVRTQVASTVVVNANQEINTTVSFGIASIVPDYRDSSVKLIGKVDDALYQAKEEGRNRIVIAKENKEVF